MRPIKGSCLKCGREGWVVIENPREERSGLCCPCLDVIEDREYWVKLAIGLVAAALIGAAVITWLTVF